MPVQPEMRPTSGTDFPPRPTFHGHRPQAIQPGLPANGATERRNGDPDQHYLGVDLYDPDLPTQNILLQAAIVALLAITFLVDLRYDNTVNITPVYIIVIFLALSLQRVRWVLGVTAASLVLNLVAARWQMMHPPAGFAVNTMFNHLALALGAQMPAGLLAYRSLIAQRRLERNRQEALSRQRALYERERAARAAEQDARRREAQAMDDLRAHMQELTRTIESEREARRREQVARGERDHLRRLTEEFQRTLLSEVPHEVGGGNLALGSLYQPAIQEMQMGGDFYDAISLPGDMVGLVIGDVAGHGVEAAAQTALVTTLLRAFASENPESPSFVLGRVNRALTLDRQFQAFVTLFYGVYNPATGVLRYSNAGHEPPIVLHEHGEYEITETSGLVIGVEPDIEYTERETTLSCADCLILFTDGIAEARRPGTGDLLGWEGITAIAQRHRKAAKDRNRNWTTAEAAADLAETLYREAIRYTGSNADQNDGLPDDVALLIVMVLNGC